MGIAVFHAFKMYTKTNHQQVHLIMEILYCLHIESIQLLLCLRTNIHMNENSRPIRMQPNTKLIFLQIKFKSNQRCLT